LSASVHPRALHSFPTRRSSDLISGPLYPYPSLALGCVDATPVEAAGMFNIFANNGVYCDPHLIAWVKDDLGNKLWKHTPQTTTRSEEHTSELQSQSNLVCRLLL